MVLCMQDKWVFVFHEKGFQLPAPSQFSQMIANVNIFFMFLINKKFSMVKVKSLSLI